MQSGLVKLDCLLVLACIGTSVGADAVHVGQE
jgi:hypothetical protein